MAEAISNRSILIVVAEPKARLGSERFKKYWGAFAQALDLSPDNLRVVSAIHERLPATVPENGIIIGGSSASAYDKNLPWIKPLEDFIVAMDSQNMHMLGVCFGHQIVAQALGATIEPGKKGIEYGAPILILTRKGVEDPLYKGVPVTFSGAMTHGDVVTTLPQRPDVALLAETGQYSNQSLAIGETIRTVQFHPEMTSRELERIVGEVKGRLIKQGTIQPDGFDSFIAQLRSRNIETPGRLILANFMRYFATPLNL